MKSCARVMLLAFLTFSIVLTGAVLTGGCGGKFPIAQFQEPEVPADPLLKTQSLNHPVTGKPGVWFSVYDAGQEYNWKIRAKAEIKKGIANTREANRLLKGR